MAEPSQLQEEAQALKDEIKSIERRVRLAKQMSARLVDSLQSEEGTSDGNEQDAVEEG